MNIEYILQILSNKLATLNTAKGQVFASGNLDQMNNIDKEILDTQNTINQLNMVLNIARAAKAVNSTPGEVVSSGLDAVQNVDPAIQGPSASAVINGYDISAYATDPLYEDKIRAILGRMPNFAIVGDIDVYIQSAAQGSPVTGDMVYKSAQQFGVDLPLMMAIMQNDSAFGTLGVGANTFNPGNIGNTGTSTKSFPSWLDGVSAVADWLNRHRVVTPTTDTTPVNAAAATVDAGVTTDTNDASQTPTPTPAPTVVLPTTPIVTATSTATFIIPTVNATTTPIVSTTTPPIIPPIATSTNPIATSTPPLVGTSTPPLIIPPFSTSTDPIATSTPPSTSSSTPPVIPPTASSTTPIIPPVATSTDPVASSTPPVAGTSTPPFIIPPDATTTTDFRTPSDATSTSEIGATSTEAMNWFGKNKKKRA